MEQLSKGYNLEKRTTDFGIRIVQFCKILPRDSLTIPLITQCLRAGTSVGANYMEANNGSSKKDFKNKIYICKKEAQETKYWLVVLSNYFPNKQIEIQPLWQETHELNLVFQKIINTLEGRFK